MNPFTSKVSLVHWPSLFKYSPPLTEELWFPWPMNNLEQLNMLGKTFNCPNMLAVPQGQAGIMDLKCPSNKECITCDVPLPFSDTMQTKSIFDWYLKQKACQPECSSGCR